MHSHLDLAVGRHLRCHVEYDTGLLNAYRCAREVAALSTARRRVDDANRDLCTGGEIRRAIIEHTRTRLGLHVEERDLLKRLEESREVKAADGGGVHVLRRSVPR